jgi:hypothetical protein
VLNLNPVARESYFGFLRAEFPSLVAEHDRLYRRKYVPQALAGDIAARAARARAGVRFRTHGAIVAEARIAQLSLLPNAAVSAQI